MLKNIVGAVVGSKLAPKSPATGSATGAMLASAVPFVLSRLSIPAMLAVGAGGYLLKRHFDKKTADKQPPEHQDALEIKGNGKRPKGSRKQSKGRSKAAKKAVDAGIINPPPGGMANGSGKSAGASAGASA